MINLNDVISLYPESLHWFKQAILREYLQYLILQKLFVQKNATKLTFIWWTALRLVYWTTRFSEDLDFDNTWLTEDEFKEMLEKVAQDLRLEWYEIVLKFVTKWAYHCHIKIPKLLYSLWLAPMETQNLTIKIDTVDQDIAYNSSTYVLNKFWITQRIRVAPVDVLLSMKLWAFFWRRKWRDIFDIVFLLSRTLPDMNFIEKSLDISSYQDLYDAIIEKTAALDLKSLSNDVQPFLFNPNDQSVLLFPEIMQQVVFEDAS